MAFNFKSLRFPRNVGTDQVPNYIRFVPKVIKYGGSESLRKGSNGVGAPSVGGGSANGIIPGSVVQGLGGLVGNATAALGNFQSAAAGVQQTIGAVTGAMTEAANAFSNSPTAVGGLIGAGQSLVKNIFDINSKHLSFGISVKPDTLQSAGSINLYLPQSLETNSSVDYETAALGGVGVGAAEASRAERADFSSTVGQLLPGAIQDLVSSGNRRAILGVATNRVSNNFSFQVFNSVLHRQFAYEFRLVAKDENESASIKEICDMFLYFMLPSRVEESGIGLYEVPCQWEIQYQRKGNAMQFHMQPKNCFLQSVDVSYGGEAGNSTYNDGAPMDVTLRLQFIEIEPLYRKGDPFTPEPLSKTEKSLSTSSVPPGIGPTGPINDGRLAGD